MEPVEPPIAGYCDDEGLFVVIVDNKKDEQRKSTATENIQQKEEYDCFIENDIDDDTEEMLEEYISDFTDDETPDAEEKGACQDIAPERCRMRLLPHNQQKSFVSKLRRQNPELDEEGLIRTLSRMMGNAKWPSPPDDFMIENETNFGCANCDFEASHKMALARHWQEKHGPRYLVCYACGADFRWPSNLYKHERKCDAPDALIVLKARDLVKQHKTKTNIHVLKHSMGEYSNDRPSKVPKVEESKPIGRSSKQPVVIQRTSARLSKKPIVIQRKPSSPSSKEPVVIQRKSSARLSKQPIVEESKPIGRASKPAIVEERTPIGRASKPIVEESKPIGRASKPIAEEIEPIGRASEPPIVEESNPIGRASEPPIVEESNQGNKYYLIKDGKPIVRPSKPPIVEESKPIGLASKSDMYYLIEESKPFGSSAIPRKGEEKKKPRKREEKKSKESYITELCRERPELLQDKDLLVQILSDKMAKDKPPPPPEEAITMTDLMFQCTYCDFKDKSQPPVARHWQSRHGPPYLECYACRTKFKDSCGLYKHEKRCVSADAYLVLKARESLMARNGRSRTRSNSRTRENGKLCCSMCPAVFKVRATLRAHEFTHKGLRPYRCQECPAAYTSCSALSRHKKLQHGGSIMFLCDKCDRTFKTKSYFKYHLDTHLPQKKHACPECDKRYVLSADLRIHIDRDHRNIPPPCACQICPKRYPKMSLLKEHMLKKHGMNLITRTMFLRNLPHLTEDELKSSTFVKTADTNIVHKSNINNQHSKETKKQDIVTKDKTISVEQPIETEGDDEIFEANDDATQIIHADKSVNTDLIDESALQETHIDTNSQEHYLSRVKLGLLQHSQALGSQEAADAIVYAEIDTNSQEYYVVTNVIENDTNSQDYTETDFIEGEEMDTNSQEDYLETDVIEDDTNSKDYTETDIIKGEEMDTNTQVEYLETDVIEDYTETDIKGEEMDTNSHVEYLETDIIEEDYTETEFIEDTELNEPKEEITETIMIDEDEVQKPSEDLLEYVKKHQSDPTNIKPMVVIKDGQAVFIDGKSIGYYKSAGKSKGKIKDKQLELKTTSPHTVTVKIQEEVISENDRAILEYYEKFTDEPNTSGGNKTKAEIPKRPQRKKKYQGKY